ncbi:Lrp/AsnC family transcriptional regulator [Dyella monticola]|uniref:Lrp/AsnC family transcriptional regulator n=1 Tax=Dyella monticola TaxID=1927958 RepID=A0A370WYJ5_9GAMM|nr:Lrp/AsnC family transcriptional regulator [Dyella monticola]RDS81156.1 Lrp/AsnC family transcriptional regulator [Dyella monticola]
MSLQNIKQLRDPTDVEIVRQLIAEPRLTISELARRVGMSAPAVRERIQRMEETGIITGYETRIDPKALGYTITVFVRVRPMPGHLKQIAQLASDIENVVECHRVTGEDCFIVKAHLRSLEELDPLLDKFLVHGQTTTSIAQSSPVPLRQLPLPDV